MLAYDRLGKVIYPHSLLYFVQEEAIIAVRTLWSNGDDRSFTIRGWIVSARSWRSVGISWNLSVYYLTHNTEVIHDQLFPVDAATYYEILYNHYDRVVQ